MDIQQVITSYIVENYLGGETEGLGPDTPLTELNILDSSAILELAHFLRERLSVSVTLKDVNADNFHSVNAICRLVERVGKA